MSSLEQDRGQTLEQTPARPRRRLLLLGSTGQLGWELQRTLAPSGQVVALDYPEIDFTHPNSLTAVVEKLQPDVILNAVAYTQVDQAEKDPDAARAVNGLAPGILAQAARKAQAVLIHYSTDYVFDGAKGLPYRETDPTNPLGVYAKTKLEGEQAVQQADGAWIILRTSWLYSLRRDDFVLKVLKWSRTQRTLKVAEDQVGSPTWGRMLAEVTAQMLPRDRSDLFGWGLEHKGIYHLGGAGCASRFELAESVLRLDPHPEEQVVREILPARMADFPALAPRPLNTALDCREFFNTFGVQLPEWREALRLALQVG